MSPRSANHFPFASSQLLSLAVSKSRCKLETADDFSLSKVLG